MNSCDAYVEVKLGSTPVRFYCSKTHKPGVYHSCIVQDDLYLLWDNKDATSLVAKEVDTGLWDWEVTIHCKEKRVARIRIGEVTLSLCGSSGAPSYNSVWLARGHLGPGWI